MPPPRILIASNSCWNLAHFRRPVIRALVERGHAVVAVAPADDHQAELAALGATVVPIDLRPGGRDPGADLRLLRDYRRLIVQHRPDVMMTFTVKPNIFGGIAARLSGVPAIATVSGLGSGFLGGRWLERLVRRLYRLGLGRAKAVLFQNTDDRDLFLRGRLVREGQARLVGGSGIDLDHFAPAAPRPGDGPVRFLMISRLLADKGVRDYAQAAAILRSRNAGVRVALLGGPGGDNPSAVPLAEVERWHDDGILDYLGAAADVRPAIADSDCIVLPSYREGLPRSLLEAAAMARPMIATDVPGCREVVIDGRTGMLSPARDPAALADAMERMSATSAAERAAMGDAARLLAEQRFGERAVVESYLAELAR